ncbi:hypothetical protein COB87_002060 [Candidatus Wolfebacteria bacterium]|nr:hypothetical protein [Candidatus Wolfebacteria bacterium]
MKKNTQILGTLSGLALYAVMVMPLVAVAQFAGSGVEDLASDIITFINETLIPLVFALALIVFIWGLFQSFIIGGTNEEKRAEGKQLMMWGIIAFAVMVSVWGLVNILTGTLDLDNTVDLPEVLL